VPERKTKCHLHVNKNVTQGIDEVVRCCASRARRMNGASVCRSIDRRLVVLLVGMTNQPAAFCSRLAACIAYDAPGERTIRNKAARLRLHNRCIWRRFNAHLYILTVTQARTEGTGGGRVREIRSGDERKATKTLALITRFYRRTRSPGATVLLAVVRVWPA